MQSNDFTKLSIIGHYKVACEVSGLWGVVITSVQDTWSTIQGLLGALAQFLDSRLPSDPNITYRFGWTVTLACMMISIWIAFQFLQRNPRLFTVMALFACSWMLVLGGYESPEHRALAGVMSDIASFLQVYIGGLLILEGRDHHVSLNKIVWLQRWGLWFLFLIGVPRSIALIFFPASFGKLINATGLTDDQVGLIASAALDVISFVSIALGARRISHWGSYALLLAILILYGSAEIAREISVWAGAAPMEAHFIFAFAAAKLAFTATFCFIVVRHAQKTNVVPGVGQRQSTITAASAA